MHHPSHGLTQPSNQPQPQPKINTRYGAKLANIFSTRFTIETADRASGKKYRQTFRNNMTVRLASCLHVFVYL